MTCDFSVVAPESPAYRVARMPDPWAWPDWNRAGPDGTFVIAQGAEIFQQLRDHLGRWRYEEAPQGGCGALWGLTRGCKL